MNEQRSHTKQSVDAQPRPLSDTDLFAALTQIKVHQPMLAQALADHIGARARQRTRLRAALVEAVEVIQQWHNMGMRGPDASELWDIYWRNAPELKLIREALTDDVRSQS